jgi:hypothetical protein
MIERRFWPVLVTFQKSRPFVLGVSLTEPEKCSTTATAAAVGEEKYLFAHGSVESATRVWPG